eukprot:TRINITY_DN7272_c0_g1_i3.p1 TRINITY_DN7272_c0_g1~~TRINITY_DN7272_c0_g1_i3.p1  ORF type:complete len:100 (-),score=8.90 TRINITY_DN7272_c0_g1_i3:17-316(-)
MATRNSTESGDALLVVALTVSFPYFNESLRYDPDVSVLISGDGSSTPALLIEILVPVLVGGCLIVVCLVLAVLVAIVVLARYKNLRSRKIDSDLDSVNF